MFMSFQSLATLKAFCPFCSCPGVNNFLLSLFLIFFVLCPSFNGLALGRRYAATGPMYFVFCRLYPFNPPPPPATTAVLESYLSSLYTVSPLRYCIIIRWERFRVTQKEDDRGPFSIQSSLGDRVGRYAHLQVI